MYFADWYNTQVLAKLVSDIVFKWRFNDRRELTEYLWIFDKYAI